MKLLKIGEIKANNYGFYKKRLLILMKYWKEDYKTNRICSKTSKIKKQKLRIRIFNKYPNFYLI